MFRRSVSYLPQRIEMADNQILTLKGRRYEITCLTGLIWMTDGLGGDRVIHSGNQVTLSSRGSICIQAFAPSAIRIRPSDPSPHAKEKHHARSLHDAAVEC